VEISDAPRHQAKLIEILISKSETNKPKLRENPERKSESTLIWSFVFFGHLKLFRTSDFVLRIFLFSTLVPFAPWREILLSLTPATNWHKRQLSRIRSFCLNLQLSA
jgi:hypothetical protein